MLLAALNMQATSLSVQVGDIIDMHAYVGPSAPTPTPTRAAVLGEFGGALSSLHRLAQQSCMTPPRVRETGVPHQKQNLASLMACLPCNTAGLGLRLEGHLWIPQDSFCYEMQATPHDLEVH